MQTQEYFQIHTIPALRKVHACTRASVTSSWTTARARLTDAHGTVIIEEVGIMIFVSLIAWFFCHSMLAYMLANSRWCHIVSLVRVHYIASFWMLAHVCLISLSVYVLLLSIFDRCNLLLDEFGVKSVPFISEYRIVHHLWYRSVPAIACFPVLISNLERQLAYRVQFTELGASFSKYLPEIVFLCCMKHTCG